MMNYKFVFSFLTVVIFGISAAFYFEKPLSQREKFGNFLLQHPFNKHQNIDNLNDDDTKTDRPDLAWEQDFLRTMNPALGRPTPEVLPAIINHIKLTQTRATMSTPGSSSAPWIERGPNNVGGRTRAIAFDPNDTTHKKVWAGGVTGGLWYNNDITNSSSSWISVNDFWANISISCIAFDPNNSLIAYVGTGEGFGVGQSKGAGIWKTTNAGTSWTQITSTTSFYYVNDIVVRNENGTSVVYAAVDGNYYAGAWAGLAYIGLQRSVNGGTSWAQVLPNIPGQSINFVAADIEIGANNRIWIGTKSNPYSSTDRGGGRILYSDNGTTWTTSNTTTVANGHGRVELACAPSNSNYVYAMIENNDAVRAMKMTNDGGLIWSTISLPVDADNGIPSSDFSRGQAWYDMSMAVDPNNAGIVITGAIDLFYSSDSGSTWSQISQWYNFGAGCSVVHADQHAIVYQPGSSSNVVFGNDGGIQFTSAVSTAYFNSNAILSRNNNYNVTQFYACAIYPTANSNIFLAGAQDNGTQRYTTSGINATTSVHGGDGAFCFIDQINPNYQIASYVYNSYYLSTNGGASGINTTLVADKTTGKFINPAAYDNNMHILYSCRDTSSIGRIKNITSTPTSVQIVNISGLGTQASHIKVSPYTTSSTTLFVGTDAGKLFKVTNADNIPNITNITGSTFPTGSISCVEIGASENELLVTFYNYGVVSVWYTSNGGSSWVSKEGNLPDMPVRWALFNPLNRSEVILATELGVWNTLNLNLTAPIWTSSNNGLANVRVDMLQLRSSDNTVIAATHGRGLFSCSGFSPINAAFYTANTNPCITDSIYLIDSSFNNPTSWTWTITPSTFSFVNGTNANSQNPKIKFSASGNYSITLLATNSVGSNSVTKNNYINVLSLATPTILINTTSTNLCSGQLASFTSSVSNGGTTPSYQWQINGVNTGTNASTFTSSTLNNNDSISCILTSNAACVNISSVTSNKIGITINANPATPIISQNVNLLSCNLSGLSYQWYLNNSIISGATNQTYTILQSGIYYVTVTNASNCSSTSSNFNAFKSGVNEIYGMSNFNLFPNPTKDFVSLQFNLTKTKNITFSVVDLLGRKIFEESKLCVAGTNLQQLNFWFLTKGNYILQLKDEQSVFQKSIMIE